MKYFLKKKKIPRGRKEREREREEGGVSCWFLGEGWRERVVLLRLFGGWRRGKGRRGRREEGEEEGILWNDNNLSH